MPFCTLNWLFLHHSTVGVLNFVFFQWFAPVKQGSFLNKKVPFWRKYQRNIYNISLKRYRFWTFNEHKKEPLSIFLCENCTVFFKGTFFCWKVTFFLHLFVNFWSSTEWQKTCSLKVHFILRKNVKKRCLLKSRITY